MRREVIANARDAPVRSLLVLIERYADCGVQAFLSPRPLADRRGDRTELLEHFALKKCRGVFYTESLQRAFGEVAQHHTRFGVEIVERGRVRRQRSDASASIPSGGFPQSGYIRQRDDERSRRVLFVSFDDAAPLENEKQTYHCLAHDRNAAVALISAAGDDQNLVRAVYLLLAQPCLGARCRGRGGGQRVAKVQRALRSESDFVEGLSEPF